MCNIDEIKLKDSHSCLSRDTAGLKSDLLGRRLVGGWDLRTTLSSHSGRGRGLLSELLSDELLESLEWLFAIKPSLFATRGFPVLKKERWFRDFSTSEQIVPLKKIERERKFRRKYQTIFISHH